MTPSVVVLYEDQRAKGPGENFGPHSLLIACLADVLGESMHVLARRILAVPKKGVPKVIEECRTKTARLARGGRRVFALVDDDEVRFHLSLPATAPDEVVVETLRQQSDAPESLTVVLLHPNLEALILAAAECAPGLERGLVEQALGKTLNARDALLNKMSWSAPRSVRDCILNKVPGLLLLRDRVASALN